MHIELEGRESEQEKSEAQKAQTEQETEQKTLSREEIADFLEFAGRMQNTTDQSGDDEPF